MRTLFALLLLGATTALAGCGGIPYSDPYASPDTSLKADCERRGGYWHPVASVCEYPRR